MRIKVINPNTTAGMTEMYNEQGGVDLAHHRRERHPYREAAS
jgi:Asp/Glu/hydantoin racemase